jgi:GNAT superfamily N-acetyltransferase
MCSYVDVLVACIRRFLPQPFLAIRADLVEARLVSRSGAAPNPSIVIRAYDRGDSEAIREICRQAARAQPDPLFHEDAELAPLLLTDYYLADEADCCFVAETDGRVVGYIVGCKDTDAYVRALRRRLFPRLALRIAGRILTQRYRRRATYRALWFHLRAQLTPDRSGRLTPPCGDYPAHSHFNVAAEHRGLGIGSALSRALHDHLRAVGIKGLHAIVLEPAGTEAITRYLCAKRGHQIAATRPHAVLKAITGRDFDLKLLVCDLEREAGGA